MAKKSAKKQAAPAASDRQAKIQAAAKANAPGPNKILIGTVVALVAIIAVVAGVIIADQSNRSTDSASSSSSVPANAEGMGKGFVANEGVTLVEGAPTLEIYEDFRCPHCHNAYAIFNDTVTELAEAGKIQLVYHFKTVIDSNSGGDASLKAASSAMCAADAGKFDEYHNAIFSGIVNAGGQQPSWGKDFFSAKAEEVGITGAELETFETCVNGGTYDAYIRSTEQQSIRDGVNGTPVYKLNGTTLDLGAVNSPAALLAAVEAATGA